VYLQAFRTLACEVPSKEGIPLPVQANAEVKCLMYEDCAGAVLCPAKTRRPPVGILAPRTLTSVFPIYSLAAVFKTVVRYILLSSRNQPIYTKQKRRISDSVKLFTLFLFH
jgi:hypothetical protein